MSKYTPGPWRLDKHGIYIFGPDNEMIAMIRGAGENLPQAANGQLLAAAPELLEACNAEDQLINKAIELLATWIVPDSGIKDATVLNDLLGLFDGPEQRAAQAKAKAAIAKAGEKGEEHE